jgi:OOP family OmpA-OmpF porin
VTDPDETYSNWMAPLGLAFQFGGTKATPPDGDADGDGVPDSIDKCPNTPAGSIVNAVGCFADTDGDGVFDATDKCPNTPNGVKVDMDGCPLDSDGDGVADFKDQCPDTPAGTQVDATGCPVALDSDGDGVLDKDDQCSDTPKGAKVNRRGCWIVEGLLFDTNKSTIKPESKQGLDELAEVLKKNPEMKLEIQGHTDSTGSLELNTRLSKERAQAVKDYLIREGIAADRLEANGYGPSRPADTNATAEGRAQNRRVELNPM